MARLKSRYRDQAIDGIIADVPVMPETGAAIVSMAAPEPSLNDVAPEDADTTLALREQLERQRAAARREAMSERIDTPPSSAVDDAIEAAAEQSVHLDRTTTPDSVADDDSSLDDKLAATGLPPNAVHWLKSNPTFLYDPDQNQRLQDLHWILVAEGHAPYSGQYFEEASRRLNGGAVAMRDEPQDDDAVDRAIRDARRPRPSVANVEPPPRRHPPVSAPPSREVPTGNGYRTGNSRITLSGAQKEAARIAGVDEVTYAANLLRLNEEKAAGNYGGAP